MVNIYSELKLDPSASLPELQSELYHQEKVWRKHYDLCFIHGVPTSWDADLENDQEV